MSRFQGHERRQRHAKVTVNFPEVTEAIIESTNESHNDKSSMKIW